MNKNLYSLVNEFLEYLQIEKNASKLTIRNYRHYLERFLLYLYSPTQPSFNPEQKKEILNSINFDPKQINVDIVRKYRLVLSQFIDKKGLPLKRITQNYHVIALRSFLRYLIKRDIQTLAPEKIDLPKAESRSLKFLGRDATLRLLNMASISDEKGLRDKAILETLFSTGLRVSELVKLNRDQIDLERGEFGVIGKGGKARVVFLSERALDWLGRYLRVRKDKFKPLFIRYGGPKKEADNNESVRLTSRSIQRIVEKYVKKAKLPIKATPHSIRHTYATDLLRAGADIRSVQELLGHKNISTTQIYTHITNPQLRQIHKKYHNK